jgi:hypothetical protein
LKKIIAPDKISKHGAAGKKKEKKAWFEFFIGPSYMTRKIYPDHEKKLYV